jgi:hypothetical protein
MEFVNPKKENELNRLMQTMMSKVNSQLLLIEHDITGNGRVKINCSCELSFQVYLKRLVRQYSVVLMLFVWKKMRS